MKDVYVTEQTLDMFCEALRREDRSGGTVEKYRRDVGRLMEFLEGNPAEQDDLFKFRHWLQEQGLSPSSVNGAISAVNKYMSWSGRADLKLRFLKIQNKVFREEEKDLTRKDYDRLVAAAYDNNQIRLGLILETMGSTGMRISELQYVTLDAVGRGRMDIDLKGKLRTVMLPVKLRGKLEDWCREQGVTSGCVFRTRTGKPVSRQEIWREMKDLAVRAGIPDSKVYPHNFRHMFASVFYSSCHDIVKLADVLGHSSINTTRIYLVSSGKEHARQLEKLGLVR